MSIVRSPKLFSARERDIEPVVKQLLADSLLGQEPGLATKPLALAFDLDAFEAQFTAAGGLPEFLQLSMKKYAAAAKIAGRSQSCTDPAKTVEDSQSCTDPFLHCIACKSNPLVTLLSLALKNGAGCECASINEVRLALEVGFPAGNVVLDSPVKTVAEIEACLLLGVHLNIDNIQELGRIQKMRATHPRLCKSNSVIGLRINPLVGAGTIKALSVSTRRSKFGVPVLPSGEAKSTSDDDGVLTEDEFVQLFLQFPFLSCVHVHVGSQGCGLRLLSKGVARAVDMCQKINAAAKRRQVRTIDIGGGLPVNFKDEATTPTFAEYAAALDAACPILFAQPPIFDRIITEFGRALNAKTAWMVSRVEYTKKAGACTIALTHAGSDLFTRNCYAPQNYSNRVAILGSDGVMRGPEIYPRSGDGAAAPTSKLYEHDIAGPLCFAGDIIAPGVRLPFVVCQGDYVVLKDAGANTLSLWSRHCSRQAPVAYGYRVQRTQKASKVSKTELAAKVAVSIERLKPQEEFSDILRFWGGATAPCIAMPVVITDPLQVRLLIAGNDR